jgi:hypothetical protein
MEKILSNYYQILKQAAKEKTSRKKISKDLEKSKMEYGKLKGTMDDLVAEKKPNWMKN